MTRKAKILELLEIVSPILPAPIYWEDTNSILLGGNEAVFKASGALLAKAYVGKALSELYPPDMAENIKCHNEEVMRTGKILSQEEAIKDISTGEIKYFTAIKAPLRDDDGNIIGIVGTSIDITERKKMEEELHRLKEAAQKAKKEIEITLSNIVENMPGYIYWKNKDGIHLGCNRQQAESLGFYDSSEVIGKADFELFEEDLAVSIRKNDIKIMQSGEMEIIEEQRKLHGKEFILLSQKAPLKDYKGDIVGILGISIDITERKIMEVDLRIAKEAAEAANRAKNEFIANMSHDMRTPLTGIVGMSSLLKQEVKEEDAKQHAQWLCDSGEQLLILCNSILDIISAENINESDIKIESFDLRQDILDACRLEAPAIKLKGLGLAINIDPIIPQYIITDRTKLNRVLLNLLGNAIKFTEKGHITIKVQQVTCEEGNIYLEFSITDTGIGIADEMQAKVFDRLFRVSPSYKGSYQGHGVGLHIVQKYVELLGGKIQINSSLGKGSTFSFSLSVKMDPNQSSSPVCFDLTAFYRELNILKTPSAISKKDTQVAVETDTSANNLPHVLLVEDNLVALRLVESIAKQAGCRVTSAIDGEQALELALSTDFDLIITDIGLPGISGNELTAQIRTHEQASNKQPIPIVGLTAHAMAVAEKECLGSGMNRVFSKPMNLSTMKDILTMFIVPGDSPLGYDLPDSEEKLFALDVFPLLDIEEGATALGSLATLKELLVMMEKDSLPADEASIKQAYDAKDWDRIEKLAHKIKGGAVYCGTVRLRYACQYLERCRKAGHSALLEKLYLQLVTVLDDTKQSINVWLQQK